MPSLHEQELDFAGSVASAGPIARHAGALLEALRPIVAFDAAWLAIADPTGHGYRSLASIDLDDAMVEYLSGPRMAHDIETIGTDRPRPQLGPSDRPYPAEKLPTRAECLLPAGISEALAVALVTSTGRHVGLLALLYGSRHPPTPDVRHRLARLAPHLAHGIDPMRSLAAAARLIHGASAGAVLLDDGTCRPLPGLPQDDLLAADSPTLTAGRRRLEDGHPYSSFLWPLGGQHAPDGHTKVTILTASEDTMTGLTALVLLSPPPDLHGLTPRELEVLGLVVDGSSNLEIARTLVVAPRTVAAHLEHILAKLEAPTRTLAAVRAERNGTYVPSTA